MYIRSKMLISQVLRVSKHYVSAWKVCYLFAMYSLVIICINNSNPFLNCTIDRIINHKLYVVGMVNIVKVIKESIFKQHNSQKFF